MSNGFRAATWWIDRWRKSTAYTDMTAEEQGVYRNLLDECWLRGGVIPDDERILAKIGGDPAAWPRVRRQVLSRFHAVDGGLSNETATAVIAQTTEFRDRQKTKALQRVAGAVRSPGGRFAPAEPPADAPADAPAEDPADAPAEPPADAPAEDPAGHHPSVLRSPFSVLRSPASVNGLAASPPSWSREACDDWNERFGDGTAPGGRIGKALKPLIERYTWETIRPAWKRYLSEKDAEFATPQDFATKLTIWLDKHVKGREADRSKRVTAMLGDWLRKGGADA